MVQCHVLPLREELNVHIKANMIFPVLEARRSADIWKPTRSACELRFQNGRGPALRSLRVKLVA